MKKIIALILSISLLGTNIGELANVYAEENKENQINYNQVFEVKTTEELESAIENATENSLIKVYPGTYDISTLEINNKGKITIQGCDDYGKNIENMNYAPVLNGKVLIKNQDGLNITGFKISNLTVTMSSNINIKNNRITGWFELNGGVKNTLVESVELTYSGYTLISGYNNLTFRNCKFTILNMGVGNGLNIEKSSISDLYLGSTANNGSENTYIINSTIGGLTVGYRGKATNTNVLNTKISQLYIGDYDDGYAVDTTIDNCNINSSAHIGCNNGISENTVIKNSDIKGTVDVGNYGGTSRNTTLSENNYYKDYSSNYNSIDVGTYSGYAEGTNIISTNSENTIDGKINIDVGKNTLLIGDRLSYTTTENTLNLIKINEIKEPSNILKGIGYKGASIEVMSENKTFLNHTLESDGNFTLNLKDSIKDNTLVDINIYDKNDKLVNHLELTSDIRTRIPISTKEELNEVRNKLNRNYYLTSDIVFTEEDFQEDGAFYNNGYGWQPIGNSTKQFTGVFDGNGYSIKGLKVLKGETTGLFAYNSGTIKNLTMSDGVVKGKDGYNAYTGGIVGLNNGIIENCSNKNLIYPDSSMEMSYEYIGGIAGLNNDSGIIRNCNNYGDVSINTHSYWTYIGGIAGHNRNSIYECYNVGNISANNDTDMSSTHIYIGGITGGNYSNGRINKCYNTGDISGFNNASEYPEVCAGGIIGSNINEVMNCYNIGNVKGNTEGKTRRAYIGGIAGKTGKFGSSGIIIENSYTVGSVTADGVDVSHLIAGYMPYSTSPDKILNSYAVSDKLLLDEFLKKETYVGFDFENIWTMDGNSEYLYPELKNLSMEFTKEFKNIEISNLPNKIIYVEGENLDTTGLEVSKVYNNGEKEVIKDFKISGYDSEIGSKTITVSYNGQTTTFEVNVVKNNAPVIKGKNTTIKARLPFDPKSIVTATDKEDGDITDKIEIIKTNLDTKTAGVYEVEYKVTDKHGLSATKILTITVLSNDIPVITADDISIKEYEYINYMDGVSAIDTEDGDITWKVSVEGDIEFGSPGAYTLIYRVTDEDGNEAVKERTVTVNKSLVGMNTVPTITSKDVVLNVGDKFDRYSNVTAYDKEDGDISYKIYIIEDNLYLSRPGSYKITYKVEDNEGASATKTINITVRNIFTKFAVNSIDIKSTEITGKGESGATVEAFIGKSKIGSSTVNSNGEFKIAIKPQKVDTIVTLKMSKDSYQSLEKTIKVIGNATKYNRVLTTDIYKYDAGKGNFLTNINERDYSQFIYLNKSEKYAFTPSSWMKAAGLTVSMPSKSNGYTMRIDNNYKELYEDANDLLNKIQNSYGRISDESIKNELYKLENREKSIKNIDGSDTNNVNAKASLKKNLTKDIYKYDAGKGKYLTYINGKGYSQYAYLNQSETYAFTPSSWMVAAGLIVDLPAKSNGYSMRIHNPYIGRYNSVVEEIKNYI